MAIKNAVQFLLEVKSEMKKVVWPSYQEFVGSTIIVLVLLVLFMIYLGFIDAVLVRLAKYVFKYYGGY